MTEVSGTINMSDKCYIYVNSCRSCWVLTFNPFHLHKQHPLNCCKEPVVPEPLSKVKNIGFVYETCTCLQVQRCAAGKVNATVCETKVTTQRFCFQLQERMCNRTKTLRKGKR